jgi:hypothetical protein
MGSCAVARAETLELTGYAGVLGEWEITVNVTPTGPASKKEFGGPMKMRHVGYCTQDGPEERTGEIRISLVGSVSLDRGPGGPPQPTRLDNRHPRRSRNSHGSAVVTG